MQINRAEFLQVLESLQPGLTARDVSDQSSCFAFTGGKVYTFNDEIACRRKSPLGKSIEGAVHAAPLLACLRKMPEETVEILIEKEKFVIKGKGRRNRICLQADVLMPFDKVEKADEWKELHEDFSEAVYLASQCVEKKDSSNYAACCVHIGKKWIEATDLSQIIRYRLKTGVKESILIRGTSIRHIVSLDMTEFSESDAWIHFRNPTGLVLSCRRDAQEYEDLSAYLETEGEPLVLPKGLAAAAGAAEVFSAENADETDVRVKIEPGMIRVIGEGITGDYNERKKLKYKGSPMEFCISPKLLADLTTRYNDCQITEEALRVDGGKFIYVVALGKPGEKHALKEEPAAEEGSDGE